MPALWSVRMLRLQFAACLCLLASPAPSADVVWWEGEAASLHNFTNAGFKPSWYGEKAQGLSAGDWLNTAGKRGAEPLRAAWTVQVPSDGRWHFLTRKFWKHGP